MRGKELIGVAAVVVAISATQRPVSAQSIGKMFVADVRNSASDVWDVWTSPLRATSSDWVTTAGVFALSAAVSPGDAAVDRWAWHNQNAAAFKFLKPIRAGGAVFSGPTITPIAAGALVIGLVTKNQTLQDGLFGCLSSYAASSVVRTFVIYPLVARTRPDSGRSPDAPPAKQGDQYDFGFPGTTDWGRHSFPGGHMANVAACAGFLTQRFSMGIAEPLPWILVGGIAVGRVLDRAHWASDQVFGLAFGYAVGKEVAVHSLRRTAKEKKKDESVAPDDVGTQLILAPTAGGVRLGLQRSF